MFTQSKTIPRQKLYTLNASPAGRELIGRIEAGKKSWQFNFTPQEARIEDWRLVLTGRVTITPPVGLWASSGLERDLLWLYSAVLMATQGPRPDGPWANGLLAEINRRLGK